MRQPEETWNDEYARVERLAEASLAELRRDGGNVDAFALLLLSFAMQMNLKLHGQAQLDAALADIAKREMVRSGQASQC